MNKLAIEKLMRRKCEQYSLNLRFEGHDWAFDNTSDTVIAPVDWEIMDDTDALWRKLVLEEEIGNSPKAELYRAVPQWVYNLMHEIGHSEGEETYYEETALRKILDGLSTISKELALCGYFELPSEVEASVWAIDEIMTAVCEEKKWWEI